LELVLLDAVTDLVVGHFQGGARRHRHLVAGGYSRRLFLAETMQVLGFGGVVAVAIDDHETAPSRLEIQWYGQMLGPMARLSNAALSTFSHHALGCARYCREERNG